MPTAEPVVAILDDEPEMRKALRRLLTCRGFRVEEYACGEDLLEAVGSRPLGYLLLDLHMPGINGFDVLEAFHSRHIPVPIIVITAHDEPGTAERVRALGACAYLKKPVDREALLAAIAAAPSATQAPTQTPDDFGGPDVLRTRPPIT
jgi:FixJ family two-component response regulator